MDFKELSPGVYAALVPDGNANTGFIAGDGEMLVVDTMMLPASQGQEMVAALGRLAPAAPRMALNTHFHGDHTFGNMLFPGSVVMAHTRGTTPHGGRMEEMGDKMVERYIRFRPEHEDEFRTVKIVTPTLGYSRGITLHIGLRRVEMTHPGPAHADGDTLVFLPDDGVLFAGDLLFTVTFFAVLPETDTRNWVEALKELDNMSVNRVVPGHGPMSTAHARKRLRDYLQHVQGEGRRFLNKGMSKEETSKAVSAGSGEGWDKLECHAMGVGHVYEELFRSA